MKEVAEKYGINSIITDAGGDIAKQASDIQDLIAQGVDFLVVAPQQEDGLQASIADAMDKGIPVILIDRTINGEAGVDYTAEIMSDFVWEAQQIGKVILDATGGEGNIVIIQGTQGATSTIDRQTGFMDTIKNSNLKVVVDQGGEYTLAGGQSVMETVLQAWATTLRPCTATTTTWRWAPWPPSSRPAMTPRSSTSAASTARKTALEAVAAGEMLASCSCSPLFGEASYALIAKIKAGLPYELKKPDMRYPLHQGQRGRVEGLLIPSRRLRWHTRGRRPSPEMAAVLSKRGAVWTSGFASNDRD
jgi:cellobiose-specific phosphotransferase system component IIB